MVKMEIFYVCFTTVKKLENQMKTCITFYLEPYHHEEIDFRNESRIRPG